MTYNATMVRIVLIVGKDSIEALINPHKTVIRREHSREKIFPTAFPPIFVYQIFIVILINHLIYIVRRERREGREEF